MKEAEEMLIRYQQKLQFREEIQSLEIKKEINHKSSIASLNPILDNKGILRVGGRLGNSNLQFNQKHPIILNKSHLSSLIIENIHKITLHGGNKLMESMIRRNYWIVGLKNSIKKTIRTCSRCVRYRKEVAKQLMGNLKEFRLSMSIPFTHVGIDYAGPIHMKCSKGRGQKTFKGYIAVFVCMATKAIHVEAVSDLTTEAFLAALKRFFARRGKSQHIYSDNGTNFVGACRRLDRDFKMAIKNNSAVAPILEADKIQWHFGPPAAPHFGGIWEAGVKSVKYHLKRVIGETKLTFEEMITLLSQIEAVLNSRPLCAIDSESDIDVLTSGHFLIGCPIIDCPEAINDNQIGSLDRWKLIQKLKKDFWKRWESEYVVMLQQRMKWKTKQANLVQGQIVIIKDEETHPAKWPLGKIIETHPGKDGNIRVVTLKLQNGILKRPVHKLCPLEVTNSSRAEEANHETSLLTSRITKNTATSERPSKSSKLMIWFLTILMLATQTKSLYINDTSKSGASVTKLKNNTAIYLEPISKMDIINSKWNLIVYYELGTYYDRMHKIQEFINRLENQCKILTYYEDACIMITTTLNDK
uniref:Integrase catalytic domain-containing protein n=1 Tax=Bactrocera latifrons TaxID=174628 RepID=A0A0K8VHT8_BACLA